MKNINDKKIKIAILGTRGIPAFYGGFETFAQELSVRLVKKGFDVTVYCRRGLGSYKKASYQGVHLVYLPVVRHKYLETIVHAFFSTIYVLFTDVKIVYYCNAINSIFTIIPRIFGKKTIINVDGLEWKRKKWSRIGKFAYKISERIATLFANVIITDSQGIHDYYKEAYNKSTVFISYGATPLNYREPGDLMRDLGLKKRGFVLYVSRLEPENNADIVVKAYENVKSEMPLIMVGDAPYASEYIANIKRTTDKRIRFIGSVYGAGCDELRANAMLYIHGNEVGGTNPALLEAMASGNCVIVNGVSFNKEVIGDAGFSFEPGNADDLKKKIDFLLNNPDKAQKCRTEAVERVKKHYNWDDITRKYEELFSSL